MEHMLAKRGLFRFLSFLFFKLAHGSVKLVKGCGPVEIQGRDLDFHQPSLPVARERV